VRVAQGEPTQRLVHITDIHHKGDRAYLQTVVNKINALAPDFVCFTGDLVEHNQYLAEALGVLSGLRMPVYGVPGNHDYNSNADFSVIASTLKATGGAWMVNEQTRTRDGQTAIFGSTGDGAPPADWMAAPGKKILLAHYPDYVKQLGAQKIDLLLAGHSHGGQVRLPLVGALMVPNRVDQYDMGLFKTPAGPLYVNPGIGYYHLPVRFNCRPEITVIEV
jgi:predicted MPP superfamily phosphohydrolase